MKEHLVHLLTTNQIEKFKSALGPCGPKINLKSKRQDSLEEWVLRLENSRAGVMVSARPKRGGEWRCKADELPAEVWKLVKGRKHKNGGLVSGFEWKSWARGGVVSTLVKRVKQALLVFVEIVRRVQVVGAYLIEAVFDKTDQRAQIVTLDLSSASEKDISEFVRLCKEPLLFYKPAQ